MPHMANLPWMEMYFTFFPLFFIFMSSNFTVQPSVLKQMTMIYKTKLNQWKW